MLHIGDAAMQDMVAYNINYSRATVYSARAFVRVVLVREVN